MAYDCPGVTGRDLGFRGDGGAKLLTDGHTLSSRLLSEPDWGAARSERRNSMGTNLYRVACCGVLLLAVSGCGQRRALPVMPTTPMGNPAMVLDQASTAVWDHSWTVTSNDLPTLPRLMAVEVDLKLGNPGPATASRSDLTMPKGAISPAHGGT